MADNSSELLNKLKDNAHCNEDLAQSVKQTILEPFRVDPSRSESLKQPPRAVFKQLVNRMAPLSIKIANQNINQLEALKKSQPSIENRIVVINCLVDSSFYALAALRHMNATKHLEIEKTTSNLLCKMVDLGEYGHALDELVKFQDILASLTKVQLKRDTTKKEGDRAVRSNRGFLTESQNNQRESPTPTHSNGASKPAPDSQWEDNMLKKYEILFQFPIDSSNMTDTTIVLLVLAYQMNAIRCWCGIKDKSLSKYLPYLLEQPGSFMDWAKYLCTLDPELGKRQLDSLQRILLKASNTFPSSANDVPYYVFSLQALSSVVALYNTNSVKQPMDRLVRSGMAYEKNARQVNYNQIQKYCGEALKDASPSTSNLMELSAYFTLCEFNAYISKKAKSYKGAFYAYKAMIKPVREIITVPANHQYYHSAYAANAKLQLGAVQMDKIVTDDIYADINLTLREITSCLHIALNDIKAGGKQDEYFDQAMITLCKSIEIFRQSANGFHDFIMKKAKESLKEQVSKKDPFRTPPRHKDIPSSENMGAWANITPQLSRVLVQCSEVLPPHLAILKKKAITTSKQKRPVTHESVMLSFIDIMSLLAKIQFNIDEESSHEQAYDYLSTAEEVCAEAGFTSGYRWISGTYYTLGASMYTAKYYTSAVYPLRKSCTLLEKDTNRISTDEGRLQLCKRYDILGDCCQKKDTSDESLRAYRLALKRVPIQSLNTFVKHASTECVHSLAEKFPLIPKIMNRFLRTSVVDEQQSNVVFATSLMNIGSLTPIQTAIIYEYELKIWNNLGKNLKLSKYQFDLIDKLLNVYDAALYPIRRARVLLDKARLERVQNKDHIVATKAALKSAIEAANLLNVESYGNDGELLGYRRHYLALASSWVAICKRELNEEIKDAFSTSLQQWGILLRKIPTIFDAEPTTKADLQHVLNQMDDVDRLYNHIHMLADLFGMTGKYIYQINALRILLKLNNGLRSVGVDYVSESVIISCTIAKAYLSLGYTGKASLELAKVRMIISTKPCSTMAEVSYLVNHAYYLAEVEDIDTSKDTFNAAKVAWETSDKASSSSESELDTARETIARWKLLSDAYMTKSLILSYTGTLDSALRSCDSALYLLFRGASAIKKKNNERSESTGSSTDPFGATTESKPDSQYASAFAGNIAFRESQWAIAQKISECLQRMSTLYLLKGSWQEAKYYIKQCDALGNTVDSQSIVYYSQLNFSDYHLYCGDFESSQEVLKQAFDIQKKEVFVAQDSVKLKMAMMNYELKRHHLAEAIETVDASIEMLNELKTDEKIISIEKYADIEPVIPMDHDSSYDSQVQSSILYECKLIDQLQAELSIKKSIAYVLQGDIEKGTEILEEIEESGFLFKNEVELGTAWAHIKVGAINNQIQENSAAGIILNKAMSLPTMKLQSTRPSVMKKVKKNTSHDFRMIKDNLSEIIEMMVDMYRTDALRVPVHTLYRLCKQTGFSMFLKNQLMTGGSHSSLSSYYIEMGNSIGLRRDMISSLEFKTKKYIDEAVPSDTNWPKVFETDEVMTEASPYLAKYKSNDGLKWLQAHNASLLEQYQQEHTLDDAEFQEKFIDILPKNWTVCSLSLDPETGEIYAVQLRQKQAPLVFKIPINRMESNASFKYEDAVAEMKNIIAESDVTIEASRSCVENTDVEKWWSTRNELDERLRKLLASIENQWLGGFKSLLSAQVAESREELNRFQKSASELIFKAVDSKKRIEISLNCCRMILRLGYNPQQAHLEDVIYFLLSCYELQEMEIDYKKIKVASLAQKLKLMVSRYHEKSRVSHIETTKVKPDEHLILILDKHLHMFPLESMPLLRSQAVSRLPCISLLRDRIHFAKAYNNRRAFDDFGLVNAEEWKDLYVSEKSTYYVVNPSGDLKGTQQEFETPFKRAPGWDGIVDGKPTELQLKSSLLSKDIYIYLGHGAGQTFMRGQVVKQLPRCAVSLLMGCSSGALKSNGDFDPHGYVLNYLLGGSPAVVSNLWDVTDRSIDKLTKQFLKNWGMFEKRKTPRTTLVLADQQNTVSLVQAVADSRNHCNLPFLIGAATVVYGIPVYLKNN